MCKNNLSDFTIQEIVKEIERRGLITNAKSNKLIFNEVDNIERIQFILTKGLPTEQMECRECRQVLNSEEFSYYQSRVDQNGYLWRSNALCGECATYSNKSRKVVLDSADIPDRPKKGDECPKCERPWIGKWHRHHEGDKFIEWLCGHCNTHLSDQRNKLTQ